MVLSTIREMGDLNVQNVLISTQISLSLKITNVNNMEEQSEIDKVRKEIVDFFNAGGGNLSTPDNKQMLLRWCNTLTGQNETAWNCNNVQFFAQKIAMETYTKYKQIYS
jgi:hypothetical protein